MSGDWNSFVDDLQQMLLPENKGEALKEAAAQYAKLPIGYRKIIATAANMPAADASKKLTDMTPAQLARLQSAVQRFAKLNAKSLEILVKAKRLAKG